MSAIAQAEREELADIDEPVIDVRAMRLDLQAQLINTKGLSREIGTVVDMMKALLEEQKEQLPDDFRSQMTELIELDLVPCVNFQNQSTDALDKQMSRFLDKITKIANQ